MNNLCHQSSHLPTLYVQLYVSLALQTHTPSCPHHRPPSCHLQMLKRSTLLHIQQLNYKKSFNPIWHLCQTATHSMSMPKSRNSCLSQPLYYWRRRSPPLLAMCVVYLRFFVAPSLQGRPKKTHLILLFRLSQHNTSLQLSKHTHHPLLQRNLMRQLLQSALLRRVTMKP